MGSFRLFHFMKISIYFCARCVVAKERWGWHLWRCYDPRNMPGRKFKWPERWRQRLTMTVRLPAHRIACHELTQYNIALASRSFLALVSLQANDRFAIARMTIHIFTHGYLLMRCLHLNVGFILFGCWFDILLPLSLSLSLNLAWKLFVANGWVS